MQGSVGDCVRVSTHLVGSVCVDKLKMRSGKSQAPKFDLTSMTAFGGEQALNRH